MGYSNNIGIKKMPSTNKRDDISPSTESKSSPLKVIASNYLRGLRIMFGLEPAKSQKEREADEILNRCLKTLGQPPIDATPSHPFKTHKSSALALTSPSKTNPFSGGPLA